MFGWIKSFGAIYHGLEGRWRMGGLLPAQNDDEAVTKAQLDAVTPVPFAASVSVEVISGGGTQGISNMLDLEVELPVSAFVESGAIEGIVFYIDTQRCSYWEDINVAATASDILDVVIVKPTVDNTECNSLVLTELNDVPLADSTITVDVVISGGGHSITRTLTVNVVADP